MKASEPPHEDDFRVGEWLVHPSLNRISGARGEFTIEPRTMSVLVALKRQAGQVVTRQQLHDRVWGDVTVSEETVNRAVFDLRQVLRDEARDPRYIETIRKVGYRLVAPVSPADSPPLASEPVNREPRSRGAGRRWWLGLAALVAVAALGFLWSRQRPVSNPTAPPLVRQLTAYAGFETHPTVSSDGRRLAFAWDGGRPGNTDIYWRPVDEDSPVRLTTHPDREDNPAWSPDGQSLSFVRSGRGKCALMLVSVEHQRVVKLGDCREAGASRPVWTSDGAALIFSDRDSADEPFRLQRLDVESGQISLVSPPVFGTLGDLYPAVSPSGTRLAFVRAVSKSTISTYLTPAIGDVFLQDLDGAAVRSRESIQRTFDNQVIAGLTWSISGDRIVFASTREGLGYSLWQVPAERGDPSLLVSTTGLLRYPVRAGDGRFAYERWEGKTDIWSVPLTGDADDSAPLEGTAVQVSTRSDLNPQLSPDGKSLAFTSERTGNYEIWVRRSGGEQPVQLTFFKDTPAESPMWSPTGHALAFEVRGQDGSHVYKIDAASGEWRQLTSGAFDDRSPTWSLDADHIFFASNRSGTWQVWRMRADGKEPERVTTTGGFRALESDHTATPRLYFSKRDRGGIWELDAQGDERLLVPLAPEHWGNWTIVNGKLFFVELLDDTTLIKSHDLRDQTTAVAGEFEGWISRETPNLAITTDQTTAVLARFTGLAADLLIVDPGP